MPRVKLTIRPDQEVEVDDREFENLKNQLLLVDDEDDEDEVKSEPEADSESEQDKAQDKRLEALEKRRAKSPADSEGS